MAVSQPARKTENHTNKDQLEDCSKSLVPVSGPTSLSSLPPLIRDPALYIATKQLVSFPHSSGDGQITSPSSNFVGFFQNPVSQFGQSLNYPGNFSGSADLIRPGLHPTPQLLPDLTRNYLPGPEIYSRKVFLGGLPIDIKEEEIMATFRRFGRLVVDWPRKPHNKTYYPPKGYAFLVFEHESAVKMVLSSCFQEDNSYFVFLSSPTLRDKAAHVRPWRLADTEYYSDGNFNIDHRVTVYLTGIPRPMTARELGEIMESVFGGVAFVGLDVDPFLKYPKCQGRVAFKAKDSYVTAVSNKFIHLKLREMDKRAEIKPYIVDDQSCDQCGRTAPYFCGEISCLRYFCQGCWTEAHFYPGYQDHQLMVKENWDRRPPSSFSS